MDEQTTITTYEPPVLVELGEFSEDTLGLGPSFPDSFDFIR
jgi:hypothetical protein